MSNSSLSVILEITNRNKLNMYYVTYTTRCKTYEWIEHVAETHYENIISVTGYEVFMF